MAVAFNLHMTIWKPGPPSCFLHLFQFKNVKLPNVHSYLLQNVLNCCFWLFFSFTVLWNVWAFSSVCGPGRPCSGCVAQLNLVISELIKRTEVQKMIVCSHYYAPSNKLCRDNICEVFFWRHLMVWALGLHSAESLNWSGLSVREHSSSPSVSIGGFWMSAFNITFYFNKLIFSSLIRDVTEM